MLIWTGLLKIGPSSSAASFAPAWAAWKTGLELDLATNPMTIPGPPAPPEIFVSLLPQEVKRRANAMRMTKRRRGNMGCSLLDVRVRCVCSVAVWKLAASPPTDDEGK